MPLSGPIKLLIVQGHLPHYRLDVFDYLGQGPSLDVTVLHSGRSMVSGEYAFREVIVDEVSIGPLRYQRQLLDLVNEFDVVIVMFDLRYLSTLRLLFSSSRAKIICWGHGFGRKGWVNKLRIACLKYAHALILYDSSAVQGFVERGIPEKSIFVAHNTVRVDTDVQWNEDRNLFLFVGRFTRRKKVRDLLKAFQMSLPDLPNHIQVCLVGDGAISVELKALAAELNIEQRVRFLGKITSEEHLAPLFAKSLAVVSPGHVGLSVLHSFAHGVPVVTTQHAEHAPEVNNMQDGKNSLFYDGSIGQLKEKLIYLAKNPDNALQLGKNAYEYYSENRTIDKMSAGFTDAIEYVLNT